MWLQWKGPSCGSVIPKSNGLEDRFSNAQKENMLVAEGIHNCKQCESLQSILVAYTYSSHCANIA